MRRFVLFGLLGLGILIVVGIILPAIQRARQEEEMRRCQNHLRQIGSFAIFHSTLPGQPVPLKAQEFFPTATVPNEQLTVEQRLSWYVLALGALEQGPVEPGKPPRPKQPTALTDLLKNLDVKQSWDADPHQTIARTRLPQSQCPAQTHPVAADQPSRCNYLGNGGIGAETPALAIDQAGRRAGVFRYDTPTPLEAIRAGDGTSNTIAFIETTTNLGPWIRGGVSTVRCLDLDQAPFLGAGRLYAGCHRGKGNFSFADGSVRVFTDSTNAAFFRSLLTIQGGDSELDQ